MKSLFQKTVTLKERPNEAIVSKTVILKERQIEAIVSKTVILKERPIEVIFQKRLIIPPKDHDFPITIFTFKITRGVTFSPCSRTVRNNVILREAKPVFFNKTCLYPT